MKFMLTAALLVVSTVSFSQSGDSKQQAEEVKENKEPTQEDRSNRYARVVVDESRMNRENLKFTFDFNLTGQMLQSQASGINIGYFKDLDNIIYLSYFELEHNDYDWFDEELDNGYIIEAALKHFVGNSFYIRPSIYFYSQELADDEDYDSASNSYIITDKTVYKAAGVGFNIGNQWQWENFTVGCNWIGVRKDISIMDEDGPGTDAYQEVTAEFMTFYLGASF